MADYPLIRVESGPFAGRELTLHTITVIGRGEDCDLRLVDEKVSRKHACIEVRDGMAFIKDLGSINGVIMKGKRVSEVPLNDGDRFKIGASDLVYVTKPETDKKTQVASPSAVPAPPTPSAGHRKVSAPQGGVVKVVPAGTSGAAAKKVIAAAATTPNAPSVKAEGSGPRAATPGSPSGSPAVKGADPAPKPGGPKKRRTQVESVIHSASADIFSSAPTTDDVSSVYRLARHLTGHLEAKKLSRMWLADVISELHADTGALLIMGGVDATEDGDYLCVWPESSEAPEISRTVTERVLSSGDALLAADLEDDGLGGSASLAARRIATLVAAPVPLQKGHAIVCLDRRGPDKPPFVERDLALLVEAAKDVGAALDAARTHAEHLQRMRRLSSGSAKGQIMGQAPNFRSALEVALKAAPFTSSVLVCGPTGTGKELVARLIHDESPRASKPFIAVNCAAVPENLQESELFGHEKGAFTGAVGAKEGYFRMADGGTLFLDEIGELSEVTQSKLLRVLESGEFYPVGSTKLAKVDVRIVAATNRDMPLEVGTGRFRQDLFHRLNVVCVNLPALRDRVGDVRLLAMHFLEKKSIEMKRPMRSISEKALAALERYPWPGNVRELANIIERAVVLTTGVALDIEDFPAEIVSPDAKKAGPAAAEGPITLEEAEKRAIIAALKHTGWQKTKAAEILGVSWPTLQKKIQDYGLKQEA
ncbi:MAG TPA: sigma 54-interacting transcriptional regulator [Planctomycetota bacterium]|nr:sigma 54-interacting transcriptional regulator [Planctomycetota bacterium]